jgi:hypothetical protein
MPTKYQDSEESAHVVDKDRFYTKKGERDNFSPWQKQITLDLNVKNVISKYEAFKKAVDAGAMALFGKPYDELDAPERHKVEPRYYMCEHCTFVSSNKSYFEVDHRVSCAEGGNANRESVERTAAIQLEVDKPLDKQHIGLIASTNLNDQVLCHGCNQGKKSQLCRPDEIPNGCGFAYRREENMNPDGPPALAGPVFDKYRGQLAPKTQKGGK